jgi:hypothetical protein
MARQNQIKSEKAGEFTFGVEIECMIPAGSSIQPGYYHQGNHLTGNFPEGWKVERDSSIVANRGFKAAEFVSPILVGEDGLNQVLQVVKDLNEIGARVNKTCGFHVHVGAKSVAGELADDVAGWVSNLIHLMGQHELALYASTGSRYRATACRYTGSIKNEYSESMRKELKKKKWDVLQRQITGIDRYRTLNVNNMLNNRMTVEFRVFAGTLNPTKILGHIQMALALCEKAMGPAVAFNAPVTRIYRGGDGLKALERLHYLLGWSLGRKDVGNAECSALGWVANLEQIKDVKSKLREMARKFDSNTES